MANQAFEGEVVVADAHPGAVDAPVEGEEEADRELGDGMRRIGRHAHHRQAEALRRLEVDIVEARRAKRDDARPTGGELFQDLGIEGVVDEDADRREALGQARGRAVEARLQEIEGMAGLGGGLAQEDAVVGLGAEDGNVHVLAPLAGDPSLR